MNPLTLNRPTTGQWFVACNPVQDVYHLGYNSENERTDTGQAVMIYGDTPQEVCGLLFSDYELDDDNGLVSYTLRDATISVGYPNENAANGFINKAQNEVPKLLMRPLKHPDREEYALIVSSHLLQTRGVNGPDRASLNQQIAAQAAAGNHKTPAQASADGWQR